MKNLKKIKFYFKMSNNNKSKLRNNKSEIRNKKNQIFHQI